MESKTTPTTDEMNLLWWKFWIVMQQRIAAPRLTKESINTDEESEKES